MRFASVRTRPRGIRVGILAVRAATRAQHFQSLRCEVSARERQSGWTRALRGPCGIIIVNCDSKSSSSSDIGSLACASPSAHGLGDAPGSAEVRYRMDPDRRGHQLPFYFTKRPILLRGSTKIHVHNMQNDVRQNWCVHSAGVQSRAVICLEGHFLRRSARPEESKVELRRAAPNCANVVPRVCYCHQQLFVHSFVRSFVR